MKKAWPLGSRSGPRIAPATRFPLPRVSLPLLPDPWPMPQGGPSDSTHRHCLQHQWSHGYISAFQTKPPLRDLGSPSFSLPGGQLRSPPLWSIFTHKGPPLSRDRGCCSMPVRASRLRPFQACFPPPAYTDASPESRLCPSRSLHCPRPPALLRCVLQPSAAFSGLQGPTALESPSKLLSAFSRQFCCLPSFRTIALIDSPPGRSREDPGPGPDCVH